MTNYDLTLNWQITTRDSSARNHYKISKIINQEQYIKQIQNHEGIIHKIIGLYADCEEDKKDLHQEILLQGWKAYPRYKGEAAFGTWLYKICLNTALTFRKKEKTRTDAVTHAAAQLEENVKGSTGEEYETLYLIIKQLDEVDKMIITLHLDGFKNPEIAEITGMTTNNINVKVHRIKAQIIDSLKMMEHGHIWTMEKNRRNQIW